MIDIMTLAAAKAVCGGGEPTYYQIITDEGDEYITPNALYELVYGGKPFVLECGDITVNGEMITPYLYPGQFYEITDFICGSASLMVGTTLVCVCVRGDLTTDTWTVTARKVTSSAV